MNKVVQKSKSPRQATMTATCCVAQSWLVAVKEIREETKKPKLKCLKPMQSRRSEHGVRAHRERPNVSGHKQPTIGTNAAGLDDASTREDEVLH